ncbi:polyphosphate kinase 2 family protein [Bauldia sp.]|uniref:polyphosphate kinase 2 family protein n=1 Tax=Bauldia sp. TaxID=2575872 RepID=UPI003BAAADF8
MTISIKDYRVPPDHRVELDKWPTRVAPVYRSKDDYRAILEDHVETLSESQRCLAASETYAVLLVLQGMDAAGKDGTIAHVLSGVNPAHCQVANFRQPSSEERLHDFLWRTSKQLPERGRVGIFNRSYYEDVLVVRVHPDLLAATGIDPKKAEHDDFWQARYRSIVDHEAHLHRSETRIVKVFLHLSWEEQRERFLARIEEPEKNWKFSEADATERQYWPRYMKAYGACLSATSTDHAPWYVVPADDKENARLIVSQILVQTFGDLKLEYPSTSAARRKELKAIESTLKAEDGPG